MILYSATLHQDSNYPSKCYAESDDLCFICLSTNLFKGAVFIHYKIILLNKMM